MEKNLFRSFKYEIGSFSKDQRKAKVFFTYKETYKIILPLMIRKSNFHNDEKYYVNEAKKIIARMIKNGSLQEYSEKYLKNKKKKKVLAILIPLICVCAIAGVGVGIYYLLKPSGPIEPKNEYFYIKNIGETEASLTYEFQTNNVENFPDIHYSFDKKKWETLTIGTEISDHAYCTRTTIAPNKTIYYYGDNPNGLNNRGIMEEEGASILSILGKVDNSGEVVETQDGRLEAGGNITSLLYGKKFKGRSDMPTISYGCFEMLFYQNYNLVTAKDLFLPSTGPMVASFIYMFYACKNLEYAPTLWASNSDLASVTTMSCYVQMFCLCPYLREIRVNFSEWPTAGEVSPVSYMLAGAGSEVDSPTFYWKGLDDPKRTIIPPDNETVPEGWVVKHW